MVVYRSTFKGNLPVINKVDVATNLLTSPADVGELYNKLPNDLKNGVEYSASQIAINNFFDEAIETMRQIESIAWNAQDLLED